MDLPSSTDILSLVHVCDLVCRDVLAVKKNESALIITNPELDVCAISLGMFRALQICDISVTLIVQPVKTTMDFCEEPVAQAIRSNPDILISLSANKLGKDAAALKNPYMVDGHSIDSHFQYLLASNQSRGFWAPGITREIFTTAVPVHYAQMKQACQKLKDDLDQAIMIHIHTPAGTDLYVDIDGRNAMIDDGDFSAPGLGGNLPAGETFISPAPYKAYGRIVFDGSLL